MKDKFEKFERLVLDTESKDYHWKYYEEAGNLISDVKFVQEFIERTRKSPRFSLEILPSNKTVISDYFVKQLFYKDNQSYWLNQEHLIIKLKIFDITFEIFERISDCNKMNGPCKDWVEKAIEWSDVLKYYTTLKLKDYIGSFSGCSAWCHQIKDVWNELEKKLNKEVL